MFRGDYPSTHLQVPTRRRPRVYGQSSRHLDDSACNITEFRMDGQSTQPRKARGDKEEREHLEDVVTEMRDRVEANVRYQLEDGTISTEAGRRRVPGR